MIQSAVVRSPVARQRQQVVAARDRLRRRARTAGPAADSRPPASHRDRRRSRGRGVCTAAGSPYPNVAAMLPAARLPCRCGVLRRHRGDLAGPGQVGHGGGVTARADTPDGPGTARYSSTTSAPLLGGQTDRSTSGSGRTPDAPDERSGADAAAVGEPDAVGRGLLHRRHRCAPRRRARRSTRSAVADSRASELGQHPVGGIEQQPARRLAGAAAGAAGAARRCSSTPARPPRCRCSPRRRRRRCSGRPVRRGRRRASASSIWRIMWSRRYSASAMPRKPCACSATPGIGSSLFTLPAAITSRS